MGIYAKHDLLGGKKMLATVVVIIGAILAIIFWYKKINPETSWIYVMYVISIVIIYLIVVTSL